MRRIMLSRTDNGVVLSYGRSGPRPEELRVYDLESGGAKQALAERLRAILLEGAEPLPASSARKRILITPAENGAIVEMGRRPPRVFVNMAELRDWLRQELEL